MVSGIQTNVNGRVCGCAAAVFQLFILLKFAYAWFKSDVGVNTAVLTHLLNLNVY